MTQEFLPDASRWSRVRAIYEGAAERGPDDRLAFVDEACAGDTCLRSEVDALLRADSGSTDFLERPAVAMFPFVKTSGPGSGRCSPASIIPTSRA